MDGGRNLPPLLASRDAQRPNNAAREKGLEERQAESPPIRSSPLTRAVWCLVFRERGEQRRERNTVTAARQGRDGCGGVRLTTGGGGGAEG